MPNPCKAMGNLKSDTILFPFFLYSDRRQESQEFQTKNSRAIPHDPQNPKVEKAKGRLKCWMVSRVNRGFDSHSCREPKLDFMLKNLTLVLEGSVGSSSIC